MPPKPARTGRGRYPVTARVRNRSRRPQLIVVADSDSAAGNDRQGVLALVSSADAGSGSELVTRFVSDSDNSSGQKRCSRCKTLRPVSSFYASGRILASCADCQGKRVRWSATAPQREACIRCGAPIDGVHRSFCNSCRAAEQEISR